MFFRIIVLFISVYLAIANGSKNLRYESEVQKIDLESVPVDHARARRGLAGLKARMKKMSEIDWNRTKKAIDRAHKLASAHAKTLGKNNNNVSEMKTTDHRPQMGSIVTRHRPNGDCSGMVSMLAAQETGVCRATEDGYWGSLSCAGLENDRDDFITLSYELYDNDLCSGNPLVSFVSDSDFPRCGLNMEDDDDYDDYYKSDDFFASAGPEMVSNQCVGRDKWSYITAQNPGILISFYDEVDTHCNRDPQSFALMRAGGCELVYEYYNSKGHPVDHPTKNPLNSFPYMRIDSCDPSAGEITVTGYSDSSCLRPIFRSTHKEVFGECKEKGTMTCAGRV